MSGVTRPKGPLPARIYWVRRMLLLALLVLAGWLLFRWIGGDPGTAPSGNDTPAAAAQTENRTPPPSARDSKPREQARKARVRTVAESFERPRQNCDLTKVAVRPSVADPAYAGEPVELTLRISTSSAKACTLHVDSGHLLVSVTSGRDEVWDSTRCEDAIPTRKLALQPRWSALVEVAWSGLYSGRHCAPGGTAAQAGTYTVQAAVLEGEPSETDFELVDRPRTPKHDASKGSGGQTKNGDGSTAGGGAQPAA